MKNIYKKLSIISFILITAFLIILYLYKNKSFQFMKESYYSYPVSVSQLDEFKDAKNAIDVFGYLIEKKGLKNNYSKYYLVPDIKYSKLILNELTSVLLEITDENNNYKIKIDKNCINRYVTLTGEMDNLYSNNSIKTKLLYTIESDRKQIECIVEPWIEMR